jgi:plastocyanin
MHATVNLHPAAGDTPLKEMRRVFHTLLALWAAGATAAPFEMQFVGVDGKGIKGHVVVTLRSTDASRPLSRPGPAPAVMDQIARQFAPHVLVIPVGSRVTFPNSDTVAHQVYSFSPAKRFATPLYSGKAWLESFDREGVVTLGCNIHDQMRAYVYVVEAQYFGRADATGHWSLANVEPGEYQLTIWHPLSRTQKPVLEQRVTVGAAGAQLTLRAAAPLKLRSESQVPANWDVY